ncbi:rhoptry neck protein RON6, partial [Cardiosporidium cionae]
KVQLKREIESFKTGQTKSKKLNAPTPNLTVRSTASQSNSYSYPIVVSSNSQIERGIELSLTQKYGGKYHGVDETEKDRKDKKQEKSEARAVEKPDFKANEKPDSETEETSDSNQKAKSDISENTKPAAVEKKYLHSKVDKNPHLKENETYNKVEGRPDFGDVEAKLDKKSKVGEELANYENPSSHRRHHIDHEKDQKGDKEDQTLSKYKPPVSEKDKFLNNEEKKLAKFEEQTVQLLHGLKTQRKLKRIIEGANKMQQSAMHISDILHDNSELYHIREEEKPSVQSPQKIMLNSQNAAPLSDGMAECPEDCSSKHCDNTLSMATQCYIFEDTSEANGNKICAAYTKSDIALCPKGYMRCAMGIPVRGLNYSIVTSGENFHRCMQLLVVQPDSDCSSQHIKDAVKQSDSILRTQSLIHPKIITDFAIFDGIHIEEEGKYKLCLMQFRYQPGYKNDGTIQVLGSDEIGHLNVIESV